MAPVLFISVGVLYEFGLQPDVYIFLSPLEEEVLSSSCRDTYTHMATHTAKGFNFLSAITFLCLGNTSKKRGFKIIALSLVLLA